MLSFKLFKCYAISLERWWHLEKKNHNHFAHVHILYIIGVGRNRHERSTRNHSKISDLHTTRSQNNCHRLYITINRGRDNLTYTMVHLHEKIAWGLVCGILLWIVLIKKTWEKYFFIEKVRYRPSSILFSCNNYSHYWHSNLFHYV